MKLTNEFVKFTVKELGLKSLPKSIKFEGDDYSAQHLTFGTYNPSKEEQILHIAKTGKPGKIDERYIDGYTAKLLVTVMHKLTTENRKKFVNESIDKMVAVAYKMVTH